MHGIGLRSSSHAINDISNVKDKDARLHAQTEFTGKCAAANKYMLPEREVSIVCLFVGIIVSSQSTLLEQ